MPDTNLALYQEDLLFKIKLHNQNHSKMLSLLRVEISSVEFKVELLVMRFSRKDGHSISRCLVIQ